MSIDDTLKQQDAFERMVEDVHKGASRAAMAVLIVGGDDADRLGGAGLQLVANRCGRNVITDRGSVHHSGTLFRPVAA